MKKANTMEIIGILSLSLLLTSSLAISGALPEMLEYFSTYSRSSVETLVSVPAVAMTIIIALSPLITKLFRERFVGDLRARLQGIRVSAETLGQTVFTFVAGGLLTFGWKYAFLIYLIAFVILFLYLFFVPVSSSNTNEIKQSRQENNKSTKMTSRELMLTILFTIFAGLLISTNVANALRIPGYIVELDLGTAVVGTNILSISVFVGFLGGLCFGKFLEKMRGWILPFFLCTTAIGLFAIGAVGSIYFIAVGAALCSFSVTNCMSFVFNSLSDCISSASLNTANAVVLVGCNLGASAAPLILKAIGLINPEVAVGFIVYAIIFISIAVVTLLINMKRKKLRTIYQIIE